MTILGSMCSVLHDHLFVVKSVKFVVIRDPRVSFAKHLITLAVIAYALFSMVGPAKQYMFKEVPVGTSNVWGQNIDLDSTPDEVCEGSEKYDFVYDSIWVYKNNICRPFAYGEVLRKLESGGLYIQTYTQDVYYTQKECDDDGEPCGIVKSESANYFVPGIDSMELGIGHSFRTLSRGSQANVETTLVNMDGTPIKTIPAGTPISLSLTELLNASGIPSLDAPNELGTVADSIGVPKFRMTGARLDVSLTYSNLGSLDGNVTKATMRVLAGDQGWAGLGGNSDYVQSSGGPTGKNYTIAYHDRYSYGILLTVTFEGEIGTPSAFTFFMSLSTFIVYLGISQVVADLVAEFMLGSVSAAIKDSKHDHLDISPPLSPFRNSNLLSARGRKRVDPEVSAGDNNLALPAVEVHTRTARSEGDVDESEAEKAGAPIADGRVHPMSVEGSPTQPRRDLQ